MSKHCFNQNYFNWHIAGNVEAPYVNSIVRYIMKVYKNRGINTKNLKVLDVGSGTGQYSFEIAKYAKTVIGVEPFKSAYLKALEIRQKYSFGGKVHFYNIPVEEFDKNIKFNLVLCLATLEHMPDAETSFKNIFSHLEEGGMVYITVPNKLWPYEYHYRLPFLSWLPVKYGNVYVKLFKRGLSFDDSSYAKSYFGLKRFFSKFPCKYEFLVPDPNENFLGLGEKSFLYSALKNIGLRLLKKIPFLWIFSKAFMVVLIKNKR
jgi:SAM-dependent methyltransferase